MCMCVCVTLPCEHDNWRMQKSVNFKFGRLVSYVWKPIVFGTGWRSGDVKNEKACEHVIWRTGTSIRLKLGM